MDIFSQQGIDESYRSGKWHDFGYGVSLKLSSTRNPEYIKATQKYLEIHPELRAKFLQMGEHTRIMDYNRKSIVKKDLPVITEDMYITDSESSALTLYSLVHGCIHDWKGVRVGEADVPFSKEKAIEILGDKRLEVFLNRIVSFTQDLSNFEYEVDKEEIESLKKN